MSWTPDSGCAKLVKAIFLAGTVTENNNSSTAKSIHPPLIPEWKILLPAFGLAAVLLWRLVLHPNDVPMPPVLQNSDLLISHLPNAQYLHRMLAEYGQLALWNAQMFAGQPFAADPLAGMWYLPNWLVVLFPQPFAFNLLFLFHLAWAGLGLFAFLREEGRSTWAAGVGAAAFMGTPKLLGHLAGGHVSLVFAVCWTPWLLLLMRRAFPGGGWRRGALAGACLGVMVLIDIRWGFYSALLAGAYAVWRLAFQARPSAFPVSVRRDIGAGLALLLFAVVLSAGLTLPLLEFMGLSRRSGLSPVEAAIFSLSAGDLLGSVLPKLGIYYELIVYPGLVPLLLVVPGLRRRNGFWVLVAVLAGVFALGPNTPFFPLAVRVVPLLGWLRVPSRVWFFVVLAIAVLASSGADWLLAGEFSAALRRRLPLAAAGLSLTAVLLVGSILLASKSVPPGLAALGIFLPLSLGIITLIVKAKLSPQTGLVMLTFLLLADLGWADSHQLSAVPLPAMAPAESWLDTQEGLFRVYSPSDSLPFPSSLEQVNGVNPLHLDSMAGFIGEAAGYTTGSYSVSLPDIYVDEDTPPEIREAAARPDLEQLGLLNVRFLAADFALESSGLNTVAAFGDTILYENPLVRPRAWMETGRVENMVWTPNRITLSVDSETGGRLILSEVMYPGWSVSVDGDVVLIETAFGVLRSVTLLPGKHRVVFAFRPTSVYVGAGLAGLGWLALAFSVFIKPRKI